MPRVTFVKKARKDNPVAKKGESYYWWKFRYGGKRYSKTYPKRSQLTQSSFKSTYFDLMDDLSVPMDSVDGFESAMTDLRDNLQELYDECETNREAMPEHLQYSGSGEILQERMDNLETFIDAIDSIDMPDADDYDDEDEDKESMAELEEKLQEIYDDVMSNDFM